GIAATINSFRCRVHVKAATPTNPVIAATEKLAVAEKHKGRIPPGLVGWGSICTSSMNDPVR
ncbi:MAG: hypothetical protein V2I51_08875, partial [Anderseniella sp.]|nr:hypothetical protein [Anderseniella sp.]